ncbi:MBL fold metallo-hydrolase [Mesobacillus harenae]|uniref:MBL fold metallo-hydrolase n=1 Tax=Mesobacillus harenae TaxID=2213203 RepID=UPI001580839E|nr:MBL fold metallo-hydrolase [Mesobacillus harenae]
MTEWMNGIAKLILPTPFPVGDVNAYLIKGDRLTLVDVGPKWETSWEALKSQLADLNLTPDDIEQIVLTHHHPDHAGGLDYLPSSMEVYGHHLNERWLQRADSFLHQHEDFHARLFVEFGIPEAYYKKSIDVMKLTMHFSCQRALTGELSENTAPPGLDNWSVIETPGHAESHIVLLRHSDGAMIGGDLLLASISPNPILEPPLPGETERPQPQLHLNSSLKKLLDYPISFVYTGHGEEVTEVHELVHKRLDQQHMRAMQVKKWLQTQELTVFEICQLLFPNVYKKELMLTISETAAQVDYLLDLGEIVVKRDGLVHRYTSK